MTQDGPSTSRPALGTSTRDFRRLWASWAVSLIGDGVRGAALPLYVAVSTSDPLATSAVIAAEVLPWLFFALPAGALVDRWNPRTVVVVAHLFRAALTGGLAFTIATGTASVPVLCALAFALTVGETFAYPASQTLLVRTAGPDHLDDANAKFYAAHTIGVSLAGPAAGGLLFGIGPVFAFALDSMTFVFAAAAVASVRVEHTAPGTTARITPRSLAHQVREGIDILWRVTGLRVLVTVVAFATLAAGALNAQTALFALEELRLRPELVPLLLITSAVATLLATRVVTKLARRFSDGPVMIAGMFLIGSGMVLFGLSRGLAVALAGYAVLGFGLGAFNVLAAARRQRLTPPEAMGRLSGAYRMVAWGLTPVGAAVSGPIAVLTSLGSVFVIFGSVLVVALLLLAPLLLRTGRPAVMSAPPSGQRDRGPGADTG